MTCGTRTWRGSGWRRSRRRPTRCSGCTAPTSSGCRTRRSGSRPASAGRSTPRCRPPGSRRRRAAGTASTSTARSSELLLALGYDVSRHVGGVHGPVGPAEGDLTNHLVLTVRGLPTDAHPDGTWYVDAGLGDALHEPMPLRSRHLRPASVPPRARAGVRRHRRLAPHPRPDRRVHRHDLAGRADGHGRVRRAERVAVDVARVRLRALPHRATARRRPASTSCAASR